MSQRAPDGRILSKFHGLDCLCARVHTGICQFSVDPTMKVFWYKSKEQRALLLKVLRRCCWCWCCCWARIVDSLFPAPLRQDYHELLDRTGFVPPRMVVETNVRFFGLFRLFRRFGFRLTLPPPSQVNQIARRILARMHQLITCIQARWRGVMVRT